jgi:type II secretory pathway component PulJ
MNNSKHSSNNNSKYNSKYNNEYRNSQTKQLVNNKGFSLFEVVIAIILGISVMAVLMTLT